jgi:hypothetical protein
MQDGLSDSDDDGPGDCDDDEVRLSRPGSMHAFADELNKLA